MPIYEYVCIECGHEFDALQKMADVPLSECPACEQTGLKKKISAPSFRLGGSGWYETDFKSDKQKNLAQADSGEKPGSPQADKSADARPTDAKPGNSGTVDAAVKKEAAA